MDMQGNLRPFATGFKSQISYQLLEDIMNTYTFYFYRGDTFEIVALTESQASRLLVYLHPETASWDLWKVECNND